MNRPNTTEKNHVPAKEATPMTHPPAITTAIEALDTLAANGWRLTPDQRNLLLEERPFNHAIGGAVILHAYPATGTLAFSTYDEFRDHDRPAHLRGTTWMLDVSSRITGEELTALLPTIAAGLTEARAGWSEGLDENGRWVGVGTPESQEAFKRLQRRIHELHPHHPADVD